MKTVEIQADAAPVLVHGWDAGIQCWSGPVALDGSGAASRAVLAKLKRALGPFYFGKFRCSVPGLPCMEFQTAVYDRGKVGLAMVHLAGSRGGPVAVLAVLPASRREHVSSDFPLELMTLVSLLSTPVNAGGEIQIHDYIEQTLSDGVLATHVFALEAAELDTDTLAVLYGHLETLAAAMLEWMESRPLPIDQAESSPRLASATRGLHVCERPAV